MFDLPIVSKQARDLVDSPVRRAAQGRARPGRRAPRASSAPQGALRDLAMQRGRVACRRHGGPRHRHPADRRRHRLGDGRRHAARGRLRRLDPPRRARARPALPPPAGLEGLPPGPRVQGRRPRPPVGWWDEQRRRAAHAHERDGPRHRPRAPPSCRPRRRSATARRCSRRARWSAACPSTAPSSTASTTSARSATPTRSARDVDGAEHVVCVGGSYIGSEVAASLTELGKRVTIVMQEAEPLERRFGARAGRYFRSRARGARDRGRGRRRDRALRGGRPSAGERVRATAGGRTIDGRGGRLRRRRPARRRCSRARPGLTLGDLGGVLCDSRLRTSAERRLRRRRHLRVRQRRPRPCRAHRARGGRRRPGRDRRAQHARRRRAARRRPVLLLRPRRLGLAGVRRAGAAAGTRRSSAAPSTTARSPIWYLEGGRVGAGDALRRRRG